MSAATTSTAPVEQPKAQLYSFPGSVWASSPRLALIEKGYSPSDVEIRTVDLLKGENFAPSYLRLNSKATLPTLVVPLASTISGEVDTKYRAITTSDEVLRFLDQSRSAQSLEAKGEAGGKSNPAPMLSPATIDDKAAGDALVALVAGPSADPNFLLLAARTSAELAKQQQGFQATFCKNRYEAIQKYRSEISTTITSTENPRTQQQSAALIKWYDDKLAEISLLTEVYVNDDATAKTKLIEAGVATWKGVGAALTQIEAGLKGPFLLGGQVSLADLQVGVWLARVLSVAQGLYPGESDAVSALSQALSWEGLGEGATTVGPKIGAYWKLLMERPSFQEVYKDGLH
ncbi:hypothetical protein BCV69DRAFT_288129 [Microstroma glucosiphilum]|uniref:GST N-terminal domain-containing protein n=1 Tax=Pseudomicrostroma glucosiphilum TaxID=1684307 RepID=A0A316U3A9_9BASI|nr:hypothetical protein BCV69DRAFT_288129 [Pseudomicrostroma glucosiphilum]PWN19284.1 hypothetical protein BCV69DRAFT_288129 [Pseudomicrostroma glucosiphilum]